MTGRIVTLALLLAAVAAGGCWLAGGLTAGKTDELRMSILWVLPAVVYLCGRFTLGRLPANRPGATTPARTFAGAGVRFLPWIAVAILLDLAPIGIGHLAGGLTFADGDPGLAATRLNTTLWALPLLVLVAIRFSEGTLRGSLYGVGRESLGDSFAAVLSIACGTMLALPALAPGFVPVDRSFFVAGLVTVLLREGVSVLLFREAGLVVAGIYRGALAWIDGYLLNDALSPLFPSLTYAAPGDSFHLLRTLGPLGAFATVAFVARRRVAP